MQASTQTSEPLTTKQEQTDGSAPLTDVVVLRQDSPRTRVIAVNCDIHGDSQSTQIMFSDGWGKPECDKCREIVHKRVSDERTAKEREREQKEKQSRINDNLKRANIPPRFAGKSLLSYIREEGDAEALNECSRYAEGFAKHRMEGRSLVLCGVMGTGKTHLACGIIRHVVTECGLRARYITAGAALRMVKETYSKKSEQSESDVLFTLSDPDLLAIDEVGVQYGSEDEKRILFEIINARYEKMKPTIIISNLDVNGISEMLGDRVVDRLRENGGALIVVKGKSYRQK